MLTLWLEPIVAKWRQSLQGLNVRWWPRAESNCRHKDFQSSALPTELPGHQEPNNTLNLCVAHRQRYGYLAGSRLVRLDFVCIALVALSKSSSVCISGLVSGGGRLCPLTVLSVVCFLGLLILVVSVQVLATCEQSVTYNAG